MLRTGQLELFDMDLLCTILCESGHKLLETEGEKEPEYDAVDELRQLRWTHHAYRSVRACVCCGGRGITIPGEL